MIGAALPAVIVRPARPGDADGLARLEDRCFLTDRVSASEYAMLLADPDWTVLVIDGAAGPVGVLALEDRNGPGQLYIYSLAVHPDWRQLGLATRLLAAAEEKARDLQLAEIVLEVSPDNTPARTLYEEAGFLAGDLIEAWYDDGGKALRMTLPVPSTPGRHARSRRQDKILIVTGGASALSPSCPGSIRSFQRALESVGVEGEIRDLKFADDTAADAAFLRTFTQVGGPAHRLAQRFERAGKPVLDRPASILRGCDKVHQAMILGRAGLPTPITRLVSSLGHLDAAVRAIGNWPIVVKDPAGAFCTGIEMADGPDSLAEAVMRRMAASGSAVLQEFVPTPFDWRIGVLDGQALFAARYWMAPGSWKIREEANGESRWGRAEGIALSAVPTVVLAVATTAARAMGPGLWGLDLKVGPAGPIIIEVNDNPNIDDDVEAASDRVWSRLAQWFRCAIDSAGSELKEGRAA